MLVVGPVVMYFSGSCPGFLGGVLANPKNTLFVAQQINKFMLIAQYHWCVIVLLTISKPVVLSAGMGVWMDGDASFLQGLCASFVLRSC